MQKNGLWASGRSVRALAMGLLVAALAAPVGAHMSPTATLAHPLPDDAKVLGAAAPTQPLRVVVNLALQNRAGLDDFMLHYTTWGDRAFGQPLSPETFIARYSPNARQAQTVADYLRRSGFKKVRIAPNRLLVSAEGNVAAAETAFQPHIVQLRLADGHAAYANTRPAAVPDALAGTVIAVLGLQNVDHLHSNAQTVPATTSPISGLHGYDLVDLRHIYGGDDTPSGGSYAVGILALGDLKSTITDLGTFEDQHDIPRVPVSVINVGAPIPDPVGAIEWNLDSQAIVAMAGSLQHLYFYSAQTDLNEDFELTINRIVTDHLVGAANISLGICEGLEVFTGAMPAFDQLFMEAAAQGQTFFVASGDSGARNTCINRIGPALHVEYPASSPWVVAVGGTTLTTTEAGDYLQETAWNGSGGGYSEYEASQPWQKAITHSDFRSVPDIAMDANPYSGAIIVASGVNEQVGGTSLASPLSAGAWTRIWSQFGDPTYFFAPLIYAYVPAYQAGAHDITEGANGLFGLYSAGPGYDSVTGLGSFNIHADIYGY